MKKADYITMICKTYGIMIEEECEYKGAIKKTVTHTIYIPMVNEKTGEIISFLHDKCIVRKVRSFQDVKWFLKTYLNDDSHYGEKLKRAMERINAERRNA